MSPHCGHKSPADIHRTEDLYICMVSAVAHVKNRIGQVVASLEWQCSEGKGVKEEEWNRRK